MAHVSRLVSVFTLGLLVVVPRVSEAGPPLICHPFETGGAAVLPWGTGPGWNTPDARYDIQRLTGDTLRLLADAPVLARMENLRRATIYAAQDGRVANELLAAVLARALATTVSGPPDANALFDAGYLIESYKQAVVLHRHSMLSAADRSKWSFRNDPGSDGYALVARALRLAGTNPDMEFAASLMKDGPVAAEHRRRARAAATAGSLLARNLAR